MRYSNIYKILSGDTVRKIATKNFRIKSDEETFTRQRVFRWGGIYKTSETINSHLKRIENIY